jgi:dTDP-4-dehydrorhamnose reductase
MLKPLAVVIGSNGQLGSDIVKTLQGEDYTIKGLTHKDLDITTESCYDSLVALAPDIIINTAAYHNLKACEDNPATAERVNGYGPLNLARVCDKIGATLVHISTDHVFDGRLLTKYDEYSNVNPINTYGKSKVSGERLLSMQLKKHYILRVSALYGHTPPSGKPFNFVDFVVNKALKNEPMSIVGTQFTTPTFTINAAYKLLYILDMQLPYGIYHCSDDGVTSVYDFARKICEYLGINAHITSLYTSPDGVLRPPHCEMASVKLTEFHAPWENSLYEYLRDKYPEHTPKR